MPIAWRTATWPEIEAGLSIQPNVRGDALIGTEVAIACWRHLVQSPFFASCTLESRSPIGGHRIVGLGASVFVSSAFADAEIAKPRPDINSRVMASIHAARPVLATREEVGRANAREGVDILVLCGVWRDDSLSPAQRHELQTLLVTSFTEQHAGYRIRRVVHETADEAGKEFLRRSTEYKAIADYPQLGRVIHVMTHESVKVLPASIGNILFRYSEPVFRLRQSEQRLLLSALNGATDTELASELEITFAAVKARWRSTFARIEETMPALVADVDERIGRGSQKRHRVLAYVRKHLEELRPYDWTRATAPVVVSSAS